MTRGATGVQSRLDELVFATDCLHGAVIEWQESARGLQRRGPGVSNVDNIRSLPRRHCRLDARLKIVPANDLKVDLDAGLLSELLQLRGKNLLVVVQAGALIAGPVGDGATTSGR